MSASQGNPQLFAAIANEGSAARVKLVGPNFGEREGPIVVSMIESHLDEHGSAVKTVVLDFTDVEFINSSGLGSCVTIHRNATARKNKVALFNLSKPLLEVFKMTHLHKLFKVVDSDKALAKLMS